jgi:uncharacterized phage-associated protein
MAYTPLQVANTFLARFAPQAGGIEHMKLQKLDYFVHGWWLAYHDNRLLSEPPQVWKYGPVFPSLYQDLKIFGSEPLLEPVRTNPFGGVPELVPEGDQDASALITWVWGRYGHLSAFALSDMTHRKGSAWQQVAESKKYRVPDNFPLVDEAVRAEFESIKGTLS